jgi:hypothetical protein
VPKDAKAGRIAPRPSSIWSFAGRNVAAVNAVTEEFGGKYQRHSLAIEFSIKGGTKGNTNNAVIVAFTVQSGKVVGCGGRFKGNFGETAILMENSGKVGWPFVRDAVEHHCFV